MDTKKPWYREGLDFGCTGCGACCGGAPGYVWVTPGEMREIAAYLGLSGGTLGEEHVTRVRMKYSLVEAANGDCVLLRRKDGKTSCMIYAVRPVQCRTWPFWDSNLSSRRAWETVAGRCPGMNRGPTHGLEEIERQREQAW